MTSREWTLWRDGKPLEVMVFYRVEGRNRPALYRQEAEYPECEIVSVRTLGLTSRRIELTEEERAEIEKELPEWAEADAEAQAEEAAESRAEARAEAMEDR